MLYTEINYTDKLDHIVSEAIDYLSASLQANTIFFSTTNGTVNTIRRVFNRRHKLLKEGEIRDYRHEFCQVVTKSEENPLVINDLSLHPLTKGHPVTRMVGTGSLMGVPIYTEDNEIVGSLCVLDLDPYHFAEEDVRLMKMLGFIINQSLMLEEALITDRLTGLYNRSYIFDHFPCYSTTHSRIAVLYLDFDYFKEINDIYGHAAGDKALQSISRCLTTYLPSHSTVARIGGDEFVVLLPQENTPLTQAYIRDIFDHIYRECHNEGMIIEGDKIFFTFSAGVSMYPEDGNVMEELLNKADMAMYGAKDKGKNRVEFYKEEILGTYTRNFLIKNELKQAVQKEQFHLMFQPLIELGTNRIIGAESLLRWTHPYLGVVSPFEFIPIAENAGLMRDIGSWVLEESFRLTGDWIKSRKDDFQLAVNISPQQFEDRQMAENIIALLHDYQIPPSQLNIEITEGMIIRREQQSLDLLRTLKQEGVQIALDDFGTGYSSLSYLASFPVDMIKIDKSLTMNLDAASNKKIIEAIIRLAESMDIVPLAEGIETQEQLAFLKENACLFGQGYYFDKPMLPEAFASKYLQGDIV
ncbi:diguanylate cyclase/phosphodiesterase [Sinobaca qinghaiensis]|uniref:Diguanylate cyclase/phosphodiesterase n=1 Tax=Sinobaca qinghaiensis TaxID=342944 RepID=A0A419UWL1_9BACL|nr:bifunctional diguanylate cyclase/phosphodiesterase [Sinobaca qinghaiensis]RKD69515.1 diguanylate cyclase/phosphodiesterase [Sinobaca qinghaiensis]